MKSQKKLFEVLHIAALFTGLLIPSFFVGCVTSQPFATGEEAPSVRHEQLQALLWQQTAVEYAGVARGAYALAALRMDAALSDTNWSASLEQLAMGNFASLPPAVVLDVDETVLDNSAFQARLIEDDLAYNGDLWNDWVGEEKAGPVPGALDFTRYAASRGVHVIYLTNREDKMEEATRNNLAKLGFPLTTGVYSIISKAERPEWASSNKTPRREFVAEKYRILLLIGDNYGDFSEEATGSLAERTRSAGTYNSFWGKKWIVLPNAMYGSWDTALYDFNYSVPEPEKIAIKRTRMLTER